MVDDVRGVAVEQAAFAESLQDEGDVALFEVAHAAVDELGAAAGGALGEVVGFEEEGLEAAGGGIDGDAESGGASADDDEVPLRFGGEVFEHLFAVHRGIQSAEFRMQNRSWMLRCVWGRAHSAIGILHS